MGVPASQPVKQHLIALTHHNNNSIHLNNLNTFITKQLYTIYKTISHHKYTNYNISHNNYWLKVKSILYDTASISEAENIIQPTIDILLTCINSHYHKLIDTIYKQTAQQITSTYDKINQHRANPEDTTQDLQISITTLLHQLKEQTPVTQIHMTKAIK